MPDTTVEKHDDGNWYYVTNNDPTTRKLILNALFIQYLNATLDDDE